MPPDRILDASVVAAFAMAVLAALFAALWRRDREPGMAPIGLGFALAAAWYAAWPWHVATSAWVSGLPLRLWSIVLAGAVIATTAGVVDYLGAPGRRQAWLAALLAPVAVLVVALAVGIPVHRGLANLAMMVCYVGLAVLALRRAPAEPHAGHPLLALALLAVPATFVLLLALRVDPGQYRLVGALPILLFGMTLLTVSQRRDRQALMVEIARRAEAEAALGHANHSLEATVAQRTAELQELVAGLQGFNRSVSHDLRGPLGGIAGLARLAGEAVDRSDLEMVRRSLAAIAAQADTSTKLIGALLTLAHVSDARLVRATVALESLTREVIAQLRLGLSGAAAAQWVVGPLPEVQADPDLLRPVLVNLMTNAVKFARPAVPPVVRIEATENEREVTVHVRDNGVGFEPGAAAQLFQPFMRLHGRRFEGHGIGLSIVRRAVERHGGRVWAESRPDEGAAFHFTLPKAA